MKPLEELSSAELKEFIAECKIGYRDASVMFEFETAKMYKERILEYRTELDKRSKAAM
ncbi:hypothetical protein [Paenibacillus turpanensis]|uniref:hypothetical protein n=1 Tax=Paenibacillus turpanensis TaxID=2689078 RepID=UPI0014082751|nr:hypothetical protein [Paenibacillus turpanensis]